jgi:hypothetical protein
MRTKEKAWKLGIGPRAAALAASAALLIPIAAAAKPTPPRAPGPREPAPAARAASAARPDAKGAPAADIWVALTPSFAGQVRVFLNGPAGTTVKRASDAAVLGATPLSVHVPYGREAITFVFTREGDRERRITVVPDVKVEVLR